jgi:hypothetical protein
MICVVYIYGLFGFPLFCSCMYLIVCISCFQVFLGVSAGVRSGDSIRWYFCLCHPWFVVVGPTMQAIHVLVLLFAWDLTSFGVWGPTWDRGCGFAETSRCFAVWGLYML